MFDFKNFRRRHGLTQGDAAKLLGVSQAFISQIERGTRGLPQSQLKILKAKYNDLPTSTAADKKSIPLFSDISLDVPSNNFLEGYSRNKQIDPGDLFPNATAAIRHFGDAMTEYPDGSILALKEVKNKKLIIWGHDYVIETDEFRIVKRLQKGADDESFRAYSTSPSSYENGQLMHEPMDILCSEVVHLYIVIGCVIKNDGASSTYSY